MPIFIFINGPVSGITEGVAVDRAAIQLTQARSVAQLTRAFGVTQLTQARGVTQLTQARPK